MPEVELFKKAEESLEKIKLPEWWRLSSPDGRRLRRAEHCNGFCCLATNGDVYAEGLVVFPLDYFRSDALTEWFSSAMETDLKRQIETLGKPRISIDEVKSMVAEIGGPPFCSVVISDSTFEGRPSVDVRANCNIGDYTAVISIYDHLKAQAKDKIRFELSGWVYQVTETVLKYARIDHKNMKIVLVFDQEAAQ